MSEETKKTLAEVGESPEQVALGTSRRRFLKGGVVATVAAATPSAAYSSNVDGNNDNWRVRRNVANISAAERAEMVQSILHLKSIQSPYTPSLSYYDQFVHFHQAVVIRSRMEFGYSLGHQSPAFLPWHRKLLLLFENAVRANGNPEFALPYWDWTDASGLETVFSDEFMGPAVGDPEENYALTTGPFRKGEFSVNLTSSSIGRDDPETQCPFDFIARGPTELSLPTAAEVEALLQVTRYDSPPYNVHADISTSFRNYLLGKLPRQLHSVPHVWVGGTWDATVWTDLFEETTTTFVGSMMALDCSPNDPCFWIHHCNVDRIWAMWEAKYGASYEPLTGENPGWNLNDELFPYTLHKAFPSMMAQGITNASMLDFTSLNYSYEELEIEG